MPFSHLVSFTLCHLARVDIHPDLERQLRRSRGQNISQLNDRSLTIAIDSPIWDRPRNPSLGNLIAPLQSRKSSLEDPEE